MEKSIRSLQAMFRQGGDNTELFTASFCAAWSCRWGWASAPREDCLSRVETKVGGHDSAERSEKRLSFIRSAEPVFFVWRGKQRLWSGWRLWLEELRRITCHTAILVDVPVLRFEVQAESVMLKGETSTMMPREDVYGVRPTIVFDY